MSIVGEFHPYWFRDPNGTKARDTRRYAGSHHNVGLTGFPRRIFRKISRSSLRLRFATGLLSLMPNDIETQSPKFFQNEQPQRAVTRCAPTARRIPELPRSSFFSQKPRRNCEPELTFASDRLTKAHTSWRLHAR
jgi:hypothetical protein